MPKKRKDGRYQSSVTVANPLTGEKKKIYVYGYSNEELEREKNIVKRNNGRKVDSPSFGLWKDEWLKIKKDDKIAAATLNSYKDNLKLHISPMLDKYKLKDITPSLVRSVLRKIDKPRVKEYCYVIINAIMQQAFLEDLILKNPCLPIKRPKHKPQITALITEEEFEALMFHAKGTQYEGIFRLAYDSGMRRSEIAALKWKDIDFQKGTIKLRHAIKFDRHAADDKFSIGKPKSENGIRELDLTNASEIALKKQFEKQKKLYADHNRILSLNDFVFASTFSSKFGDIMEPDSITHGFVKLKKAAGIKSHITFKSFRHTLLTTLGESNDIPVKAIQAHAGHSNAAFTLNRYIHRTPKMEAQIVDFLNNREEKGKKN